MNKDQNSHVSFGIPLILKYLNLMGAYHIKRLGYFSFFIANIYDENQTDSA